MKRAGFCPSLSLKVVTKAFTIPTTTFFAASQKPALKIEVYYESSVLYYRVQYLKGF